VDGLSKYRIESQYWLLLLPRAVVAVSLRKAASWPVSAPRRPVLAASRHCSIKPMAISSCKERSVALLKTADRALGACTRQEWEASIMEMVWNTVQIRKGLSYQLRATSVLASPVECRSWGPGPRKHPSRCSRRRVLLPGKRFRARGGCLCSNMRR
jgi:hypothetical protein